MKGKRMTLEEAERRIDLKKKLAKERKILCQKEKKRLREGKRSEGDR